MTYVYCFYVNRLSNSTEMNGIHCVTPLHQPTIHGFPSRLSSVPCCIMASVVEFVKAPYFHTISVPIGF